MFAETGKKFIESFSEIKNQNSVAFVIQKCSRCFVSEAFELSLQTSSLMYSPAHFTLHLTL